MNQHAGNKESAIAKLERLKEQKKKKERAAKVKEIKKRISLRVPQYKFDIPPEVPKVDSREFHRWMHPWRFVGQHSPGFAGSPVRTAKELKKLKEGDTVDSCEESDSEEIIVVSSDDSDDDSDDYRYKSKIRKQNVKRKKRKEERIAKEKEGTYEDFVIPNIIDAQTGKKVELTKSFWSSEEGRVNRDTQGILDEQTGRLFFDAKQDFGHYVVESITNKKPYSRGCGGGGGGGSNGESNSRKKGSDGKKTSQGLGHGVKTQFPGSSPLMRDTTPPVEGHHGHGHHHHAHHHVHHTQSTLSAPDVINPNMTRHKHLLEAEKRYLNGQTLHVEGATGNLVEHQHNPLHHLHINVKGEAAKHVHVHHHNDDAHHIHGKDGDGPKHVQHAHRQMNDLVARFLKNGPLKPMYHVHWDRASNTVQMPEGYVNDEDGDAESYISHEVDGEASPTSSYSSYTSASNSPRTSISSVGFDSLESNSLLKSKQDRDKKAGRRAGTGSAGSPGSSRRASVSLKDLKEAIKMDVKGNINNSQRVEGEGESDIESISILSDAMDPNNEVTWRALEDKYYNDIRHLAVDYESNKVRTHEKPIEGGAEGMDIKCREYASWKARTLKFIVQAIDEEKEKDEARNALEEELEINNPEKLLNTVKKHNEERHKHRTYIRNFKYEAEILGVQKLYDIGLVW